LYESARERVHIFDILDSDNSDENTISASYLEPYTNTQGLLNERTLMQPYTVKHFVQLENQVWSAFVAGDAGRDSELLTDDFLGVYDNGFLSKQEHADQLNAGPLIAHHEISEAQIKVLAEGLVLLSYRVSFVRYQNRDKGLKEVMRVSSIWRNENGLWKNAFSQDTPVKI
jgi:hypothetical protein